MFNFMDMANNYDSRKVDRYEDGNLVVSTVYVTDGSQPYETAVLHPSGSVTIETDDDLTTAELVIEAVTVKTPDTFLIDIRGRVNYFRQEFNLTYAEAIGCLEIVKAELLEEVMHDEEEA